MALAWPIVVLERHGGPCRRWLVGDQETFLPVLGVVFIILALDRHTSRYFEGIFRYNSLSFRFSLLAIGVLWFYEWLICINESLFLFVHRYFKLFNY